MKQRTAGEWITLKNDRRPKVRYWMPAAAVDEEDLRQDLRSLSARGFGGVEVVVLNTTPPVIAKSADGWGTPAWDRAVEVIAEETKALGMSFDLAIGPGWPIASPVIKSADDPAALQELTWGELALAPGEHYEGPLPERRTKHDEGTPVLVSAFAYLETADHVLEKDSYIELTDRVRDGRIGFTAPEAAGESDPDGHPEDGFPRWKLFAFYRQPAVHKINSGQDYVIDHLGAAGAEAVEKYWDGVFSRYRYDSLESFFCDSLEYEVSLEWTAALPEEFLRRRGYSVLPYLPFIGVQPTYPACDVPGYRLADPEISDRICRDYLETVTQLYCECHLAVLERMAEKYGKTVRYQVAYNRPLEAERSALFVAVPENEALGRPSVDYQKIMAAAAHLGRKDRYSFECAAEFGHSYGQSYEDLFWWVKRAAMAGMNAQVLHGASYSGRMPAGPEEEPRGEVQAGGRVQADQAGGEERRFPAVEWPGFEGFGKLVSNYWNRTPSVRDARGCLDAIARLNTVLRERALVDCAVFRDSYLNSGEGSEFCLYPDDGALANAGYTYEFLSETLLGLPECHVREGRMDAEGPAYKCLILPEISWISGGMLRQVLRLRKEGLPVLWIGAKPMTAKFYGEADTEEKRAEWAALLEEAWAYPGVRHVRRAEEIPAALAEAGILPEAKILGAVPGGNTAADAAGAAEARIADGRASAARPSRADVITFTREAGDGTRYYGFYGLNRVVLAPDEKNPEELAVSGIYRWKTVRGSYRRPGEKSRRTVAVRFAGNGPVSVLEPFSGREYPAAAVPCGDGFSLAEVTLEEDELVLLKAAPAVMENPSEGNRPAASAAMENPSKGNKPAAAAASVVRMPEERALPRVPAGDCFPVRFRSLTLREFGPDTPEETSFLRSSFREESREIALGDTEVLAPWRVLDPDLVRFSGEGVYRAEVTVPHKESGGRWILRLGEVCDTFRVYVNGQESAFPDQVKKSADITELIREGTNSLEIVVTSNLYNCLFTEGMTGLGLPLPYFPRNYGLWPEEGKPVRLEWLPEQE